MSTAFIIFYILAVVSALLALAGLVLLASGLINKNHKSTMTGSILTGLAVIFVITGLFFGARKCYHVIHRNCMNNEMKCHDMDFMNCEMPCDSMMMMMDSTMSGDSCKMRIEKKVIMNDNMSCDKSKCDPSKCKEKCEHKK
jgi:hypothetical protein